MSMTGANWSEGRRILIVMGLLGAALIYGDGIITPAISVLSAQSISAAGTPWSVPNGAANISAVCGDATAAGVRYTWIDR
jgi:hypothetical protein